MSARDVKADERTCFVVTLRAEPRVDGAVAVRALLKTALRRYGLRCVAITGYREAAETNGGTR